MNQRFIQDGWLVAVGLLALSAFSVSCSDDEPRPGDMADDESADGGGDLNLDLDIDEDETGDTEEDQALDGDASEDPADAASDIAEEIEGVACGQQPQLPECETVGPAPTTDSAIEDFAATNAIPLRCVDGNVERWEFDILFDEFASMKVMLMGEVHGSNEIGMASADLFEALVETDLVDTLVIEIGMDVTDSLNEFVRTGEGDFVDEYGYGTYGDDMFRRSLPDRARELYLAGTTIDLVGVDSPQRLAWVNEQIALVAADISDETVQDLILDSLPRPREMNDYGMLGIETSYVNSARDYYDHIIANLEAICEALDEAKCDRLEHLAFALYVGAVFNSEDFMMAMMSATEELTPQLITWLDEREDLIFWNFRQAMPTGEERLYGHMGAAHVAKTGDQPHVAGLMNTDFEPTVQQVYTLTPAYGPGSRIFYGFFNQDLPAEPLVVSNALAEMPVDNYFLSTRQPGMSCVGNPFVDMEASDMVAGAHYGRSWDAFFWFWRLTPDMPSGWSKSGLSPQSAWAMDNLRRMQAADRLMSMGVPQEK